VRGEWTDAVKSMVARLRQIGPAKEGFELGPGRTVINPEKYHVSMLMDADAGPKGPRSRIGAFQQELRLYLMARGEPVPKEQETNEPDPKSRSPRPPGA
jgi:hypothetical protein